MTSDVCMIRLGVLDCGELPAAFTKEYGTFSQWFDTFLSKPSASISFHFYNVWDRQFPQSADECDAYLITGSSDSVFDDLTWLNELKAFVLDVVPEVPCVGICFGHQLLHQVLGGSVERSDTGWCIGTQHYRVHQQTDWMKPGADTLDLLASHQDQVVVPAPDSTTLASSATCPVAMSAFRDYAISMQPHPELQCSPAEYIFRLRRDEQGHQLTDAALASLDTPLDDNLAAQWIVNFLIQSTGQSNS